MPSLIIGLAADAAGSTWWQASPANSGISYVFTGATLDEQATAVQQLAAAMQQGNQALANGIPEIFNVPNNAGAVQQTIDSLFGATDGIVYNGVPAYTAVGDEVLTECLDEAGIALALAL